MKFEFSLLDDHAELLLSIIRDRASETRGMLWPSKTTNIGPEEYEWYIKHARLVDVIADTVSRGSLYKKDSKQLTFKDWLERRIADMQQQWSILDRASPQAIATSGKLTAYKEILDYLTKH